MSNNCCSADAPSAPLPPHPTELTADIERPRSQHGDSAAPLPNGTLPTPDLPEAGGGSMVALLMNVQGLLRMAIESAKHKEQTILAEKGTYMYRTAFFIDVVC